ncbi:aminotransferase class V-fold PLP-dependent enzyme [Streptomyces catenulae]|uniref:Aminotransferase class V-fold PLP-dependent enzyme n=1 Tax=Streptomyces catenulae TaxID=66875 RepID=A0ABV2YUH6_9ACTN|nr:aminotransferase class V-fold PLP-dependent enzyme [Streptomyces catenulae]
MSDAIALSAPPAQGLDALRATEFGYLDEQGHLYLDHAGAGLPARSRLREHAERITGGCFGNPHSVSPASAASTALVERARAAVLRYLRADPAEYAVVFTANATGACRLVGEAFPFAPGGRLTLTLDNHNSVVGLRSFATAGGASVRYIPFAGRELRMSEAEVDRALGEADADGAPRLFAYPAQSNFTGVRHPLDWIGRARGRGWRVLLDAAAHLPTNRLDLSRVHPDFVALSWYKVFGYPTGLGALVARRESLAALRRPWFSGGTVQVASARGGWHRMTDDESAFEDGTLNYLSIPDIATGLEWLEAVGIDAVHDHVTALTARLLDGLRALRHGNGAPMVRLFGPETTLMRGGTVALHLLAPDGTVLDERAVARDSAARGISLRTGCFCNPGAGESAFGIPRAALEAAGHRGADTVDDYVRALGLPFGGAVRVSLGAPSNARDVRAFLEFVTETYRDRPADGRGLPPRVHC